MHDHAQACNTEMKYIYLRSVTALCCMTLATRHQSKKSLKGYDPGTLEDSLKMTNKVLNPEIVFRGMWPREANQGWAGQQLTCWSARRFPREPRPPACDARLAPQRQTSLQHRITVWSSKAGNCQGLCWQVTRLAAETGNMTVWSAASRKHSMFSPNQACSIASQ